MSENAMAAPDCDHYWAWVSPAGTAEAARLCMSCNQPSAEWLNEIATVERERREAWAVAAQRRSEARRYYVAWQSARMRAAAALRKATP